MRVDCLINPWRANITRRRGYKMGSSDKADIAHRMTDADALPRVMAPNAGTGPTSAEVRKESTKDVSILPKIRRWLDALFGGGSASGNERFQTDDAYARNRAGQTTMTPQTVAELRKYGVTDQSRLKLEYFFYTNTEAKAAALAQRLSEIGYAGRYDHSASNRNQFVVTGWTSPMKIDDQTVLAWTLRMCETGCDFDCEFDGWGTDPGQS